jgi:hypothetical protein
MNFNNTEMRYNYSTNQMSKTSISISFLFILFLFSNCKNNQSKTEVIKEVKIDSFEILRPSYLVSGITNPKDHQRQIVDEWYKFRYVISGSCFVSNSDRQAAEKHNKKTDSILSLRIGKNWKQRFEKSVDSLYTIDSTAIAIASADSYILNFDTTARKYNKENKFYANLLYTAYATNNKDQRLVAITGYGITNKEVGRLNYLRATVDLKKKKVINIDKTVYVQ